MAGLRPHEYTQTTVQRIPGGSQVQVLYGLHWSMMKAINKAPVEKLRLPDFTDVELLLIDKLTLRKTVRFAAEALGTRAWSAGT